MFDVDVTTEPVDTTDTQLSKNNRLHSERRKVSLAFKRNVRCNQTRISPKNCTNQPKRYNFNIRTKMTVLSVLDTKQITISCEIPYSRQVLELENTE